MINPEKNLWCSVLKRAIEDASGTVESQHHKATREAIRRATTVWFERGDRDFRMVCEMADFDPDYVQQKALVEIRYADRHTAQQNHARRTGIRRRYLRTRERTVGVGADDLSA